MAMLFKSNANIWQNQRDAMKDNKNVLKNLTGNEDVGVEIVVEAVPDGRGLGSTEGRNDDLKSKFKTFFCP
jgi:hypothetical protein